MGIITSVTREKSPNVFKSGHTGIISGLDNNFQSNALSQSRIVILFLYLFLRLARFKKSLTLKYTFNVTRYWNRQWPNFTEKVAQ